MTNIESLDERRKDAWRTFLTARARLVDRIDRTLVAAEVLPFEWYDILLILEEAEGQRVRLGELADAVLISKSGLTRLVDRIEAAGYLRREADISDRRAIFAVLTEAGLAARKRTWPVYSAAIVENFARFLSDEEAEFIQKAFRRMLSATSMTSD